MSFCAQDFRGKKRIRIKRIKYVFLLLVKGFYLQN
jgi:hypothetical protein